MGLPTISVVVPCFNVAHFIPQTLNSIIEQSYSQIEILVVDDGSKDEIEAALAPFEDQIRYIRIPNSGGPSRPRNIGIQNAKGDLISFCDADDLMLPEKLAGAAQVFEDHPNVDFLFTNFQSCDESGSVIKADFLAEYREFRKNLKPMGMTAVSLLKGDHAYSSLLRANFIGTSSVVCRSRVFSAAGNFDEALPNSEDRDLWRRIARLGHTFAFLDEVHHSYRIRSGSISHGESKRYPAMIKSLEKELLHCANSEDLQFIYQEINCLWLGYGWALRNEGKLGEAQSAYRAALSQRISWVGVKGLMLCSLARKRFSQQ